MNDNHRIKLYNENVFNNPQEIIELKNKEKIKLRKNKINQEIQKKRFQNLAHINLNKESKIKPELKFIIIRFEESYAKILSYLNSNDNDLISYIINEINIYFAYNNPNINEQKIIIETNFLLILLNLGKEFIASDQRENLKQILSVLINIQSYDKGTMDYLNVLCTDEFFDFYNKSLLYGKDKEFFHLILYIIDCLITINSDINLKLLRSGVFSSILNYIGDNNIETNEDKLLALKSIVTAIDLSDYEDLIKERDIKIIDACYKILIEYLFSTNTEEILSCIYRGLYNISNLDNKFGFNNKIINEGITLKIMKLKFYNLKINKFIIDIIDFAVRIIANNLTLTDKDCQIIYDLNIIDYFNNILILFDDSYKIVRDILTGLTNIAVGSKRNIILNSSIWEDKNIQKYCNMNDEIKINYIKICKFLFYHSNYDILKFIYNTKILQYFIFLFSTTDINGIAAEKILKIINSYLSHFSKDKKESEEYLIIFNKFIDLLESCDKINKLNCIDLISDITENIKNNYN